MSKLFKWVVKRSEFLGVETEEMLIGRPVLRRILGERRFLWKLTMEEKREIE